MEDILKHWGPSVAVFAPLVGVAVMMIIPRAEEQLHKWLALLTSLFWPPSIATGFLFRG